MNDKSKIFLNVAAAEAGNSHCVQLHVGAVAVKYGRIVELGYNDTPEGFKHCSDVFKDYNMETDRPAHHDFSQHCEIHAEQNLIARAARDGIALEGCDIYITHKPCYQCLKLLCAVGIKRIFYSNEYDKADYTDDTYNMLKACSVLLVHYTEEQACC